MRRFLTIALIAFISTQLSAQKQPISFEDFFSMKRLGHFSVSPAGDFIAYDVKTPHIENNNFKTEIWLYDVKKERNILFSKTDGSASHPVWSADGGALFFNHKGQIWKQTLGNDAAQQVTAFGPGAANVMINSTHMLFASDVDPECGSPACMEDRVKEEKDKKVKARVINKLFYRHWNRWLEGKRSHVFLADIDGKNLRDMTPGDYDSPPLDLGGSQDYVFSPDGKQIAFVRNMDEITAASTNNDVFTVEIASGKIEKISEGKGNDNNPLYSPNGRYLAWLSMERPGFEADRYRLFVKDLKNGSVKDYTVGFDLTVRQIVWQPDSKALYFRADEKGTYSLFKVNLATSKITSVLKGHYIGGFAFLNDMHFVVKKQTASQPYELFTFNLKTKALKQLSYLNDKILAKLDMPALEPFVFTGAKGDDVHGWLLKPPAFDPSRKYPAVQLIHGGPQGAWSDNFHFRWNYQMFAKAGYVVYAINFHGSTGYGQKFTDAVSKDWGGAPYKDLVMGTDYVLNTYDFIDKDRLGAAGASYGGFMINWINGHENPFKCLISHDGVFEQVSMYGATEELWFPEWEFDGPYWENPELYHKFSPSRLAKNFKTPTLVIHGEHDYRVPYTQGMQMFTALKRQGVDAQLLFYPDEDHFVTKPLNAKLWWETMHNWLQKYLRPGAKVKKNNS